MNYFKEAKLRWKGDTPPWFKKTQKILTAAIGLGGTITGISLTSDKFKWVTYVGAGITAFATGALAISNFVVSSLGIILQPGDSIENKSSDPIEVKPAIDQPPTEVVITPVVEPSVLPPPADPGAP